MEILIKKNESGKTTINTKELIELLDLASVRIQLRKMNDSIEALKNVPQIDKKAVLNMIKDEFLTKGEYLNIGNNGTVEKQQNVPEGIIYYNTKLNTVRLNSKDGWITLKTE